MLKRPKQDDDFVKTTVIFNDDLNEEEKLSTRRSQNMIMPDIKIVVDIEEDKELENKERGNAKTCELSLQDKIKPEQNPVQQPPDRTDNEPLPDMA